MGFKERFKSSEWWSGFQMIRKSIPYARSKGAYGSVPHSSETYHGGNRLIALLLAHCSLYKLYWLGVGNVNYLRVIPQNWQVIFIVQTLVCMLYCECTQYTLIFWPVSLGLVVCLHVFWRIPYCIRLYLSSLRMFFNQIKKIFKLKNPCV